MPLTIEELEEIEHRQHVLLDEACMEIRMREIARDEFQKYDIYNQICEAGGNVYLKDIYCIGGKLCLRGIGKYASKDAWFRKYEEVREKVNSSSIQS
jgi:hypothetical protein